MRKLILIFGIGLLMGMVLYQARSFVPGPAVEETIPAAVEGQEASSLARELYRNRNPYVGNASQNGRLVQLLEMGETAGNFHMELETREEPYVLRIVMADIPEDEKVLNQQMTRHSLLLLALIDNADAIQWTYPVPAQFESAAALHQVDRDDLYETLEVDLADFELTPDVLDRLLAL